MTPEVRAILDQVRGTCDFGYVDFVDINDTNVSGSNALHCLAVWGDCESAKILIEAGIDINKHGEDGYTPLHQAASFGHLEFVRLLLEYGADVRARTDGDLPYTIARLSGNDSVCELIASYAARVAPDAQGLRRDAHWQQLGTQIDALKERIKRDCPDQSL